MAAVAALVGLCAAFALKALALIDATTLWSDELYGVGKSFQPSYAALLAMLRQDTPPPSTTPCSGSGAMGSVRRP